MFCIYLHVLHIITQHKGHTPDNIIDYLMICYKFDAEENLLDYQENVIENYHATST